MRIGLKTVAGTAVALLTLFGSSVGGAENVLQFSGNNSYVNLDMPAILQIPSDSPMTVEGWMYLDTRSDRDMLYSKNNARNTSGYTYMFGFYNSGRIAAYTGSAWREPSPTVTVSAEQWYHVAFSFDGTTLTYYLDGEAVGASAFNFNNVENNTVKLGGYHSSSDITGRKSDVRVWDHARSEEQIQTYMGSRLTGAEEGLLGYWPLDEGSGAEVFDGTDNHSTGTVVGASWVVAEDLALAPPDAEYLLAASFTLADRQTGGERFTNSNEVDLAAFPVPDGYDRFQFTGEDGDISAVDPQGWQELGEAPEQLTFTQPGTDTNIALYAWFTNSTESVMLRRAEGKIYYTGALPVPVVRATLTRERLPGQDVVLYATDIDAGSAGGEAGGQTLEIHAMAALSAADPSDDLTPEEPYVTLDSEGEYPLLLWLRNEAGNVKTSTATCMVTVVEYSGTNFWTGGGLTDTWDDGANWTAGVPVDGQHVRMEDAPDARLTGPTATLASFHLAVGRTITVEGWNSILTATNMTIAGTITHADHLHITEPDEFGDWPLEHRIYLKGSNITIAADALLDGDHKGYPSGAGLGGAGGTRDGAGHAGRGSIGSTGTHVGGGPEYGNPVEPFQPGSGGASLSTGGYGGGAIRIAADGHLQIAGTLSVNGRNALGTHGAGGSGGSIWLNCRTFGGLATGLARANGGNGSSQGGAGSGGRIALHYDPVTQAALAEPIPPVRFFAQPGTAGGTASGRNPFPAAMGTLYLPDTLFITHTMTGQRFWYVRPVIPGFDEWEPDALTLDNTVIGFSEGFRLAVTDNLTLQNNAQLHVFAAPAEDPMTEDGAVVEVGGDLLLTDSSWIHPYACDTNGASVGFYVDGDLTIADGSGFNADGLGFRWQHGPGYDTIQFSELGSGLSLANSSGAGHGGGGGPGWNCSGGGPAGEAHAPRLAGSGGWREYSAWGGGVIRIVTEGHAQIDGLLSANGGIGSGHSQWGSASGGSIWLVCRTLSGNATGLLRVDGGNARSISGAGGGGRIAVFYDPVAQAATALPDLKFSAAPGSRFSNSPIRGAEEGSLYFPDTLLVPALFEKGLISHARLEIPGFTSWAPESLTMDAGEIVLPPGFNLDVAGDFTMLDGARLHLHAAPTNSPSEVYGARLTVGGDLQIDSNAWLLPHAEWTNAAVVAIRVTGDVTIDQGGGIDAEGKGYAPMSDNKSGPGAGQNNSSGGGYGGKGGGTGGGAVYGTAAWPLAPGSPAGWYRYSSGLRAGQGGGAIQLLAGGNIHIDGLLNADAMPREPNYGGTGASGGAILLSGRRLTGSGLLRANGSLNRGRTDADGGGGRIAVWVGMPLQAAETRVASGYYSGVFVEDYPHFGGDMQVLRASDAADDGTIEVYAISGSLIMLR